MSCYTIVAGQICTDYIYIQQRGDDQLGENDIGRLGIFPRLNFTCNGRITSIRARVSLRNSGSSISYFQVWRPSSPNSPIYNKTAEVVILEDNVFTGSNGFRETNISLSGNNRTKIQSGDVVGFYHPPNVRYALRDLETDGYVLYGFTTNQTDSVDLTDADDTINRRQPIIQFTIGKCAITVQLSKRL